jgi:5,10-methylenetetrahydrofolate reductase
MLETLIDLCFVDQNGTGLASSLDLVDLLQRMKERFGVLVNEVPSEDNTIEAGLAANLNLQEFKKRLRQLGRFESLSDEFEAQYVRSPFRRTK